MTKHLVSIAEAERAITHANELNRTSSFWARQDGQMSVQYFRPGVDMFFQPHTYAEYTIVVCLEGEIAKAQMGQMEVVGRGGAIVGNHGVEHTSRYRSQNGRPCEAVILSVERRPMTSLIREFNLPLANETTSPAFLGKLENDNLHDCARSIATELRLALPGREIALEALATRLMVEALRAWPRSHIHKLPADLTPRLPRRDFVRAHEFMRGCRKEDFRVQTLSHLLGSSEERFARLFSATTQQTPARFYNQMLLERARGLLSDPKLSVKEIGFMLGFRTSSHFVAAFRREFNSTPLEARHCNNSGMAALRLG
jgi:AraC-like DNA-binding protein